MCPGKTFKPKNRKKKTRRNMLLIGTTIAIIILIIGVYFVFYNNNNSITSGPPNSVVLHTTMGDILIQLRSDTPITSTNFKNLVQAGTYDKTIFHRVVNNPPFVIQGGDPTGTGYGDANIPTIQDEFTSTSNNTRGTVAMANTAPNTNSASSQFFINLVNNTQLDGKYAVFGTVIKGMNVVDNIAKVQVDSNYRPYANVTITKALYFG